MASRCLFAGAAPWRGGLDLISGGPDIRAQLFATHNAAAFFPESANQTAIHDWICAERLSEVTDTRFATLGEGRLLFCGQAIQVRSEGVHGADCTYR